MIEQTANNGDLSSTSNKIRWRAFRAVVNDLHDLWDFRYALLNLTSGQLKTTYQGTALGMLWGVLNPLLMLGLLGVIFSQILGRDIPDYPIFLFCGLIPYTFFSSAILSSSASLFRNRRLVTKYRVNYMIFPLSSMAAGVIDFCLKTTAVFLLLQIFHPGISIRLILLPAAILLLSLFTTGLVLASMTLVTMFRDLEHILSVLLRMLYFASPVLMQPKMLGQYQWIMDANPLSYHLRLFRYSMYQQLDYVHWPTGMEWGITIVSSLASLLIGYFIYKRYERRLIFQL